MKQSLGERLFNLLDDAIAWLLDNFVKIMVIVSIIIALLGFIFYHQAPRNNMSTPYEHYLQ